VPEQADKLQDTQHERFRIISKLSGKVALVTGRASGIGRAIVGALTAEGADIGCIYRNRGRQGRGCGKLGVRAASAVAEVSDEGQARRTLPSLRRSVTLTSLQQCRYRDDQPFGRHAVEMWDEMMRVKLRSVIL
jgi:NAD(P)-dependent dehydrogenase (short-subunit alcohol dehydrogenase family)